MCTQKNPPHPLLPLATSATRPRFWPTHHFHLHLHLHIHWRRWRSATLLDLLGGYPWLPNGWWVGSGGQQMGIKIYVVDGCMWRQGVALYVHVGYVSRISTGDVSLRPCAYWHVLPWYWTRTGNGVLEVTGCGTIATYRNLGRSN